MNNSAGAVDLSQNPWRKTWVHSQHGHWVPSSSSSLCSRNRPSVCSQLTTHNTAAGSGHQTAHPYTSTPSTPPISFRKLMIRTAGSGRKTVVNITWLPAIRHRSWETASLTMLTTYHHTVTYIIAWPAHTIYSWRFGITVGGMKAPSARRRSPNSSLIIWKQWVTSQNVGTKVLKTLTWGTWSLEWCSPCKSLYTMEHSPGFEMPMVQNNEYWSPNFKWQPLLYVLTKA
jgi:hypothetical protein